MVPKFGVLTARFGTLTILPIVRITFFLANYGIGGQYEPHYDHATENDVGDFGEEDGNRIATWLSYMSEPRYGGGTIFMEPVGIRAEPVKVNCKVFGD